MRACVRARPAHNMGSYFSITRNSHFDCRERDQTCFTNADRINTKPPQLSEWHSTFGFVLGRNFQISIKTYFEQVTNGVRSAVYLNLRGANDNRVETNG